MADFDFHVTSTARRFIEFSPVLGQQFLDREPATWLKVNLVGDGDNHAALLIRSDNLYVSGFSNKRGRLFAFQGQEHTIRGSTPLTFAGGYEDLFPHVGHAGLADLRISMQEAVDHLAILANFAGGADENLKIPLAFFILLISEAERFVEIREAVFERWADNDDPQTIGYMIIRQVVHWRRISCALLSWDLHGRTRRAWRGNQEARQIAYFFGITSPKDALSRINPILKAAHWKCTWTTG